MGAAEGPKQVYGTPSDWVVFMKAVGIASAASLADRVANSRDSSFRARRSAPGRGYSAALGFGGFTRACRGGSLRGSDPVHENGARRSIREIRRSSAGAAAAEVGAVPTHAAPRRARASSARSAMHRPDPLRPVDDRASIETSDRRQSERKQAHGAVHMVLETKELSGRAQNVSQTGLLFFSDDPLRVRVSIQEHGVVRELTGRLVRAQRMKGDELGWAIEIDPA